MGLSQFDENSPLWDGITISNASGTTPAMLGEHKESPWRVDSILVVNSGPAVVINVTLASLGATVSLGHFTVPSLSGFDGTVPTYDLLGALRAEGLSELVVPTVMRLFVGSLTTLTSGDELQVTALGGYV